MASAAGERLACQEEGSGDHVETATDNQNSNDSATKEVSPLQKKIIRQVEVRDEVYMCTVHLLAAVWN